MSTWKVKDVSGEVRAPSILLSCSDGKDEGKEVHITREMKSIARVRMVITRIDGSTGSGNPLMEEEVRNFWAATWMPEVLDAVLAPFGLEAEDAYPVEMEGIR